jgi:predicted amidohydrolase YtcJ
MLTSRGTATAALAASRLCNVSEAEHGTEQGPTPDVIELAGRTVVPGFIEGHGHFTSLGRAKMTLDLMQVRNWDEIVNMVATYAWTVSKIPLL